MKKSIIFSEVSDDTIRLSHEPENRKRFRLHKEGSRYTVYVNFAHLLRQFSLSSNRVYGKFRLKNPYTGNKMTFTYKQSEIQDGKVVYHWYILPRLINGCRWRIALITTTKQFEEITSKLSNDPS